MSMKVMAGEDAVGVVAVTVVVVVVVKVEVVVVMVMMLLLVVVIVMTFVCAHLLVLGGLQGGLDGPLVVLQLVALHLVQPQVEERLGAQRHHHQPGQDQVE